MELKKVGKSFQVLGYATLDLPHDKVTTSLENPDSFLESQLVEMLDKKLVGNIYSHYVSISIPSAQTFTRAVQLPKDIEKDLDAAIDLEVEQYIPLPKDMLTLDWEIISRTNKNIELSLCAAPKGVIERTIAIAKSVGLEPILIEPSMNSISRLLWHSEQGYLRTLILDIGLNNTDIAIFDKTIRATSNINIGGNNFTFDISDKLGIPIEKAHQFKLLKGFNKSPEQSKIKQALEPSMNSIVQEIKKILRYNEERLKSQPVEQIIITGIGSNLAGIGDYFTDALYIPVRIANPWQNIDFKHIERPKRILISRYLTVAGAAIVNPNEVVA